MRTWFLTALFAGQIILAQRNPVFNVRDYGAAGDGTTDDQAAITSATASAMESGGGTVYFPQGAFAHSDILVFGSNITVKGAGMARTIIKATNAARSAIVFQGANNCKATQFKIVGAMGRRLQNDESDGILIKNSNQCTISWIAIDGGSGAGILIHASHDVQITNNYIRNTMADGIHAVAGSGQILIANNRAVNTGDDSYSAVAYAKDLQTTAVTIRNNTSYRSRARGVTCIGAADCIIEGNRIDSPAAHGIAVAFEQSYDTHRPKHANVSGNTITGAQGKNMNAILVDDADDVTLSGNTVSSSNPIYIHRSTGVQVNDLTVRDSHGPGILARDSRDVHFRRNHVVGATGPGILMEKVAGGEISENILEDVGRSGDATRGDIDIVQSPGLSGRANVSKRNSLGTATSRHIRIVDSADSEIEVVDR